jgi:hypothetical protein
MFYGTSALGLPKTLGLSMSRLRLDLVRLQRVLDWLWEQSWSGRSEPGFGRGGLGPGVVAKLEASATGALHAHVLRRGTFVPDQDLLALLVAKEVGRNERALQTRVAWSEGQREPADVERHQNYVEKGAKQEDVGDLSGRYLHPLLVILVEIALYRQRRHLPKGSLVSMKAATRSGARRRQRPSEVRLVRVGLTDADRRGSSSDPPASRPRT